jgi:hypothetical protein
MMKEETWNWLRGAPLPVVLAISLLSTGVLGTWVWDVSAEVAEQKTDVAIAVEQAKQANDAQKSVEKKLDKVDDKLDKLLESVAAMKAAAEEKARAEAAAAKKEKK